MTNTITTSVDAAVRVLEDVAVIGGTAFATWAGTHSVGDVMAAVTAAPAARSAVAAAISGGRVSGVVAALKLARSALRNTDGAVSKVETVVHSAYPGFSDAEIASAMAKTLGVSPAVVQDAAAVIAVADQTISGAAKHSADPYAAE